MEEEEEGKGRKRTDREKVTGEYVTASKNKGSSEDTQCRIQGGTKG